MGSGRGARRGRAGSGRCRRSCRGPCRCAAASPDGCRRCAGRRHLRLGAAKRCVAGDTDVEYAVVEQWLGAHPEGGADCFGSSPGRLRQRCDGEVRVVGDPEVGERRGALARAVVEQRLDLAYAPAVGELRIEFRPEFGVRKEEGGAVAVHQLGLGVIGSEKAGQGGRDSWPGDERIGEVRIVEVGAQAGDANVRDGKFAPVGPADCDAASVPGHSASMR